MEGQELTTTGSQLTGTTQPARSDRELELYDLETRFAMATKQRELLEKYIKDRLHPGKHFYKIGDDKERKPSLTKEGAELICLPHGLKARYMWLSGPPHPPTDNTPYQITIKCILEVGGKFGGEGIGSASSWITKKDGKYKPRQNDPGLCHNATVKMASKSAYIAATLNATAASEFFTQDLEPDEAEGTDGGGKKAEPPNEKSPFWCAAHKVVWFKKGGMRGYAHPIEGGGWCNMPKEEKPVVQTETEPDEEPIIDGELPAMIEKKLQNTPAEKAPDINALRKEWKRLLKDTKWDRPKINLWYKALYGIEPTDTNFADLTIEQLKAGIKSLSPVIPEGQQAKLE